MVIVFPPQNHFAWKRTCVQESSLSGGLTMRFSVSVTLLHAIAFSSGIARLVTRAKRRLWWWDDTILIVPLVSELLSVVFLWLRYPGNTKRALWFLAQRLY